MRIVLRIRRKFCGATAAALRWLRGRASSTCYVSLGEQCLTDHILERHGLKTFTTVYSHTRSNLDYAVQMERERYRSLLDDAFLYYGPLNGREVVRNARYKHVADVFHPFSDAGFEFTHHDVLRDPAKRRSFERKIQRLDTYRGHADFKFFYYHMWNERSSLEHLLEKAEEFSKFYAVNDRTCTVIVYTQQTVSDPARRGLERVVHSDRVEAFILRTTNPWQGPDFNWALGDDDLIRQMLDQCSGRLDAVLSGLDPCAWFKRISASNR